MALIGVVVVVLLGTVVYLGQLTAPSDVVALDDSTTTTEPLSAPTTTTTLDLENFSVADIATGDGFIWFRAPRIGSFWPLELIEHDGILYLFGTGDPPYWQSDKGGLEVWSTEDGIVWIPLGEVIGPDYRVTAVSETERGFVALGNHQADDAPFIWTSSDGASWQAAALPFDGDSELGSFVRLSAAVETEAGIVVLGSEHSDPTRLLAAYLPEHIGLGEGASYGVGYSETDEGKRSVQIYGPLGLVGYTASFEELGIDEATGDRIFDPATQGRSYSWTSSGNEGWERHEIDLDFVEQAWLRPDGSIMAYGHGGFGPMLWSSADGRSWKGRRSSTLFGVSAVQVHDTWGDLLIGSDHRRELYWSHDGVEWEPLGTAELLPEQLDWGLYPVATGPGGLAVVATTWLDTMRERPAPVVIEKDGHVLTLDLDQGIMALGDGDVTTMTARLWDWDEGASSELFTVDFITQQVVFNDPESQEPIVAFDFATLERAETAATSSDPWFDSALLFTSGFSPDGGEWSIHALSEAIGPQSAIAHMAVLEDRVIMITYSSPHYARLTEPPEIIIRVGMIGMGDSG